MLIENEPGRQLVNVVAYQLVLENAPEQVPLYVDWRDRYFADPEGYLQAAGANDEVMAFGEAEVIKGFVYLVFPFIMPILTHLVEAVRDALKDEIGERSVQWIKTLFGGQEKPQPVFNQEQLQTITKEIDAIIAAETRKLGLRKRQAIAVRNAIIARLALATT